MKPSPLASSKGCSLPSGSPAGLGPYLESALAACAPCSCPLPSLPGCSALESTCPHILVPCLLLRNHLTQHISQGHPAQPCLCKEQEKACTPLFPWTQGSFARRCCGSPSSPGQGALQESSRGHKKKEGSGESGRFLGVEPSRPGLSSWSRGSRGKRQYDLPRGGMYRC